MMTTCKAIIQDGPRKGKPCIPVTTVDDNGYCTKHQRQKEYNLLISQGKRLCSKFFRGCNSEISEKEKTCTSCRNKNKKSLCSHVFDDGRSCVYEIFNNTKYCGKHQRDMYHEYEVKNGVQLCNIERGCMNICDKGFQSCKSCIVNDYIVNDRFYSEHFDNGNICIVCEATYESSILHDALKRCNPCCGEFMNARRDKKVIQQRRYSDMTIEKYYESYFKGAYKRSFECEFDLTLDEFTCMVSKPCYYCNSKDIYTPNGIDRVDNRGNYTSTNTVPCCSSCNRMKHTSSLVEFINKCNAIHMYLTNSISITAELMIIFESYKSLSTRYYSDYKKSNGLEGPRKIDFTLTKDEFNSLRTKPCYLCGVENTDDHYNGIDRIDNSKGYIAINCKPCCGHCNFFKASIPIGIVKAYSTKIATNPTIIPLLQAIKHPINESFDIEKDETVSVGNPDERFSSKKLSELFCETYDNILSYCMNHNRSNTFIRNIQKLYESKTNITCDEIQLCIIRYLNLEKKKLCMERKEIDTSIKQHKKANDVLSMLEQGKLWEYLKWHNIHVGEESTVFRKHLTEFITQFHRLTTKERIERCQEILKQEKHRRNSKRANEKFKEEKNKCVVPKTPKSNLKQSKPFIVADITTSMPEKPNIIQHIPNKKSSPKQWKASDIYDAITAGKEDAYKAHCESNNELSKIPTWSTQWLTFITQVKDQSWVQAEPVIRAFLEDLRRIRHNTLCSKKRDVLDREDRQVWPAETVAKLFQEGRIQEYKSITETYTGDTPEDPKWQKRWEEFVRTLEKTEVEKRVGIIAKFMTAQRTKKYRRSQQSQQSQQEETTPSE